MEIWDILDESGNKTGRTINTKELKQMIDEGSFLDIVTTILS